MFVCCAVLAGAAASAGEPLRIWVDATGQHSIEARWVAREGDEVTLQRADGKRFRITVAELSAEDQNYLEKLRRLLRHGPNPLRTTPPRRPPIPPQSPIDLPTTGEVAEPHTELNWVSSPERPEPPAQVKPLQPDPAATSAVDSFAPGRTVWEGDGYQTYCPAVPVTIGNRTELVMSVSSGFGFQLRTAPSRLIRVQPGDEAPRVAWHGDEAIRLLDHHPASGRSLVLLGHNSLGEKGELAMASGWEKFEVTMTHRRGLPGNGAGGSPHLRWARWIDEQHVVAMIDGQLGAWNLISGVPLYRIEGVASNAQPALSHGRRYIAVPRDGAVDLYRSTDGHLLGAIATDAGTLPSVAFSPRGDSLAIATSGRLLVWQLSAAAPRSEVSSQRSLGRGRPIWIDDDLVLSGNGTLVSLFRGQAVWRYDLAGAIAARVGGSVAIFRERPQPELATVAIPHPAARRAMRWIDSGRSSTAPDREPLLGRSQWREGQWVDGSY